MFESSDLKEIIKDFNRRNKSVYISSDHHFDHKNLIALEGYEFKDITARNEEIVKRHNEIVNQDDLVVMLGDVGNIDFVKKMNGNKVLILGNHDDKKSYYIQTNLFIKVYELPQFIGNGRILLSHYPEPTRPDQINVHGHLHKSHLDSKNHINVNVSSTNYKPVDLSTISKRLGALLPPSTKFLHEWYAELYKFDNRFNEQLGLDEDNKIICIDKARLIASSGRKKQ